MPMQAGVPHRMFLQGTTRASTGNGEAVYITISQVAVR